MGVVKPYLAFLFIWCMAMSFWVLSLLALQGLGEVLKMILVAQGIHIADGWFFAAYMLIGIPLFPLMVGKVFVEQVLPIMEQKWKWLTFE